MSFLKKSRYVFGYYKSIFRAPLNRGLWRQTLWRLMAWHVGSRLLGHPVVYPFANKLRIYVATSMWGATGVVYFGLEEFQEMSFCTHLLKADDLFVDVGACYGTFTLLAAGVGGAHCVTFEPNPATAERLLDNIRLNRLEAMVDVKVKAVGASVGSVTMTSDMRSGNHVIFPGEETDSQQEVPLTTLDDELGGSEPTLLKIDVEGFEQDVLNGAGNTFKSPSLLAVIMEDVGASANYGSVSNQHQFMLNLGFKSYRYLPEQRDLLDLNGEPDRSGQNTIYIRNVDEVKARLKAAPKFRIRDKEI